MRLDIPLLPLQVDIRWRALRPFRVSIRGIMAFVCLSGVLFALIAHMHRLSALNNYYMMQAVLVPEKRGWNLAMASECQVALIRYDTWAGIIVMTTLSLLAMGVVGRLLNRWRRRIESTLPQG